jgi:hypothetical protein
MLEEGQILCTAAEMKALPSYNSFPLKIANATEK